MSLSTIIGTARLIDPTNDHETECTCADCFIARYWLRMALALKEYDAELEARQETCLFTGRNTIKDLRDKWDKEFSS